MKILHICLACSYTEGLSYQDNILANQNAADGHEVMVISDCTRYVDGKIVPTPPEDMILSNGIRLVRLPFDFLFAGFLSNKIRKTKLLKPLINKFSPDVIFFHGCYGREILTVARYKQKNPHIKLYADCHAEITNSGRKWLSLNILHKLIYKRWIHKALPQIDKVFCISPECRDFAENVYGIDPAVLEDYPLGGTVLEEKDRLRLRIETREKYGLKDDHIVFLHAGKLDSLKKTLELIDIFYKVPSKRLKLLIAGSVSNDILEEFQQRLNADNRIQALGWVSGEELNRLFCACDIYVQPGKVSQNAQNAICCGTPVILADHDNNKKLIARNGWLIHNVEEMLLIFQKISERQSVLEPMSKASFQIAKEKLDCRMLAARLYK